MKTKIKYLIGVAALMLATITFNLHAQINASNVLALLNNGIITIGQPTTINGVTWLVTTNLQGNYVIMVNSPTGGITNTPPTTTGGVISQAQQMIADNNPANTNYYGPNELVVRMSADYLQNSGQAVVEIGVEKYGWVNPNVGFGAAIFQGNSADKSGTAGACGFIDYRKIIGDVSVQIGAGGGYDNWNKSWMVVAKADVELRQNKHFGEFVGFGYALEKDAFNGSSNKGGTIVRGGVNYSFW